MSRPLRDIEPSSPYQGDASRAWGKYDKNLDAVARGYAELRRGFNALGEVIMDRVQRSVRLEEEITTARAETEFRRRFGEAVRGLDPSDPEYPNRVQTIFNEVSDSISKEFTFRTNEGRQRFNVRLENIRAQAVLNSLDQRERALAERAEMEIAQRLNAAAAAVTSAPATFNSVLAGLQAEVAALTEGFDANRRERISRSVQERLATSYVRTLVAQRRFREAEAALRDLGGAGMLNETAITAIRAGLVAEQRQAAAEARQERAEAYRNAFLALQQLSMTADGMSLLETNRAIDQVRQEVENAVRVLGRDSPQAKQLNLALQRAIYAARDRGAERLSVFTTRMQAGDRLNENEQVQFILSSALSASRRAQEDAMRSGVMDEGQLMRIGQEAEARARMAALNYLALYNPGQRLEVLENLLNVESRKDVNTFAQAVEFVAKIGLDIPAVRNAIESNPRALFAVMQQQMSGLPINAAELSAALSVIANRTNEDMARLAKLFEEKYERSSGSSSPQGVSRAEKALKEVFQGTSRKPTDQDKVLVLDLAKRLFSLGVSDEDAFKMAARWYLRTAPAPIDVGGEMWTLPQEYNPLRSVPNDVIRLYGADNIIKELRNRGRKIFEESLSNSGFKGQIDKYDVLPISTPEGIQYLIRGVSRGVSYHTMLYVTDEQTGREVPFVDKPSRQFFDEVLKLSSIRDARRQERQQEGSRRGGSEGGMDENVPLFP